MTVTILLIILSLIWLAGTWIRIYQQARFFQIEEYMPLRYIRWLFAQRDRWLPTRGSAAGFAGAIAGLFVGDTLILTGVLLIAVALLAIYPVPPKEVKKGFNRTQRATRMLGAAFTISALLIIVFALVASRLPDAELATVVAHTLGFALWWAAPFSLVLGSLAMEPIEASIRNGFKRQARQKLDEINPTVIGITGSYGKTSTKTYIAHILNGKYNAFPTPKSWNTLMGVCRAINEKLVPQADYFICEMGAYIPGEIKAISAMTQPRIGVITEVGPQHLERFGSLENIAIAKYELINALPEDGIGVFNWDNPYVRDMMERGHPTTRIGISRAENPPQSGDNAPRFVASNISETLDGLRFTVKDQQTGESAAFSTALLGDHNVTNILLATALAHHEGMTLDEIAQRVRTLQPAEARLVRQTTPSGLTIINDAYSANPVGVIGSLRVLGMHDTGRRLLITPGMVELGDLHEQENRKLGQLAADYATDIILVGEIQTRPIYQGLMDKSYPPDRLHVMETVTEAIAWYQQNLGSGDTVLFLNDLPDTY